MFTFNQAFESGRLHSPPLNYESSAPPNTCSVIEWWNGAKL